MNAESAPYQAKSMTGFGQGSAERDGIRVHLELKGVNHRFLDVKIRLPSELGRTETDLRSMVQRRVARARIDITVAVLTAQPPASKVTINRDLVTEYLTAIEDLGKEYGLKGSVGLETVLSLPGTLTVQPPAAPADGAASVLVGDSLRQALDAYDAMRTTEGRVLAGDIRSRLQAIGRATRRIQESSAGLPEAYARQIRERLATLLDPGRGLDETRLAQEVALLASRVDITEELVRLQGYLAQAEDLMARPAGPMGKTLDFIMQEMNREANTISSKAEALPICQEALLIRAELEKIREQAQNLE